MILKAVVIGTGSAGAFRKEGNHAASFTAHKKCELVGVYDHDEKKAVKAAMRYSCQIFKNVENAILCNPQLVSLAIPPKERYRIFEEICKSESIQAIYCEKPLALNSKDAYRLYKLCKDTKKRLYVNFQRRCDSNFIKLKNDLSNKRERLQNVIIFYTRGMWTNASHWIDLCLMLFGRPRSIYAQKSPIPSPYQDDSNATILLGYNKFHVHLVPLLSWEKGFYTGDIIITFDNERIYFPNPLHYSSKHIKKWVVSKQLLEESESDLKMSRCENDFISMLNMIIGDLETNSPETIDPLDSVWSIKILELAEKSIKMNKRVAIPSELKCK